MTGSLLSLKSLLSSGLPFLNLLTNFRALRSQNSASPRQSHDRQIRTVSPLGSHIRNRLSNLAIRLVTSVSSRRDALYWRMTSAFTWILRGYSYSLFWWSRMYSNCLLHHIRVRKGGCILKLRSQSICKNACLRDWGGRWRIEPRHLVAFSPNMKNCSTISKRTGLV